MINAPDELLENFLSTLAKHSLEKEVCIQQNEELTQSAGENPYLKIQFECLAPFEHCHLLSQIWVERWEAIKRFHNAFRFFIQKGSKFPKIAGYSTIVSEDTGVLEHKPGEVTVIILNNSRMADFIKGIVLKNKWEGKIKVIEVRRGERQKESMDQVIHLFIPDLRQVELLSLLREPYILIINRNGVVESAEKERPVGNVLQKKIARVINGESLEDAKRQTKEFRRQLFEAQQIKWRKFNDITQQLSDQSLNNGSIRITAKRTIRSEFGVMSSQVEPLEIQYDEEHYMESNLSVRLEDIKRTLSQEEYYIYPKYNRQFPFEYDTIKMNHLLRKNGINRPMLMSEEIYWRDFLKNQQDRHPFLFYPKIIYKKDCNYKQGREIAILPANIDLWRKSSQSEHVNKIYNQPIWTLQGAEFLGIDGLFNLQQNSVQSIASKKGVAMMIYREPYRGQKTKPIQALIDFASNQKDLELHLIVSEEIFMGFTSNSLKQKEEPMSQNIHFYWQQQNQDAQSYGLNSSSLLVINKSGYITKHKKYDKFLDQDPETWLKPVQVKQPPQSSAEMILGLPTNDITIRLRQFFSKQDYNPEIRLSYTVHYTDSQNRTVDKVTDAKLVLELRKEHRKEVQPLLALLSDENVRIQQNYFETIDIRSGEFCLECNDPLTFPHYYFPWSDVHRCAECTEAEDVNQTKNMKRYAVNEDAILIFKPNTNVDKQWIGQNVQPKSEKEWKQYCRANYCSVCYVCNQNCNSALYICLGCYRQPQTRQVTICSECAKRMRWSSEQIAVAIVTGSEQHRQEHAWLRKNAW